MFNIRLLSKKLTGVIGTIALIAPAVFTTGFLVRDLLSPPAGVYYLEEKQQPNSPIEFPENSSQVFIMPPNSQDYIGLRLLVGTYYTRPLVHFKLCSAGKCISRKMFVNDNEPIDLLVNAKPQSEVQITLKEIHFGNLALWGFERKPWFSPLLAFGWSRPIERAREFYAAFGLDWLRQCLALFTALLIVMFLFATVNSLMLRENRRIEQDELIDPEKVDFF